MYGKRLVAHLNLIWIEHSNKAEQHMRIGKTIRRIEFFSGVCVPILVCACDETKKQISIN